MPAPHRDKWAERREIASERIDAARAALRDWWEAVREEPVLAWETPAVRYAAYGTAGLILVLTLRWGISLFHVPTAGTPEPRARTAHFDVICTSPDCGRHFLIERRFKFRGFPVVCSNCNHQTAAQALRCNSDTCQRRLRPTQLIDNLPHCITCGRPIGSVP